MRLKRRAGAKAVRVVVQHVPAPAPDAQERLRRAYELLLRAAARAHEQHEDTGREKQVTDKPEA